jgi:hypothetical protein
MDTNTTTTNSRRLHRRHAGLPDGYYAINQRGSDGRCWWRIHDTNDICIACERTRPDALAAAFIIINTITEG